MLLKSVDRNKKCVEDRCFVYPHKVIIRQCQWMNKCCKCLESQRKNKYILSSTKPVLGQYLWSDMPGLGARDVYLRQITCCLNLQVSICIQEYFLARGGMGTVLISAALEAGTVEWLWKNPQQLQGLFAGYWTYLPLPSCSLPAIPVSPFFSSTPVLVQVFGAAMEALGGTHPDWPSWQHTIRWGMYESVAGELSAWQVVPLGNHSVRPGCSQFPVSGRWAHKGSSRGT